MMKFILGLLDMTISIRFIFDKRDLEIRHLKLESSISFWKSISKSDYNTPADLLNTTWRCKIAAWNLVSGNLRQQQDEIFNFHIYYS